MKIKRTLTLFFVFICFLSAGAEDRGLEIESIVPSNASVFIKTAPLGSVIDSFNGFVGTSFTENQKMNLKSELKEIADKTGINPVDKTSLEKAGIDTSRASALTYKEGDGSEELITLYIPIRDAATFPLKFVEILKKAKEKSGKKIDPYPVVTNYRDVSVNQIDKDVFCAAVGKYFVITSQGALLRSVIDLQNLEGAAISGDALYMKYLGNARSGNDVNVFIRPEIFDNLYAGRGRKSRPKQPKSDMFSDYFNYISGGLKLSSSSFSASIGADFVEGKEKVSRILNIMKTGKHEISLSGKDALIFSFVSLDIEKIAAALKSEKGDDDYRQMVSMIEMTTGLDFEKDILPSCEGVFNILVDNPITGDYAGFTAAKSAARSKALFSKMMSSMKTRFTAGGKFGTTSIGKSRGFWIVGGDARRIYFSSDTRGIYAGTNPQLLLKLMGMKQISGETGGNGIKGRINENTFLMTLVKKNDLLSNLLVSQLSMRGLVTGEGVAELAKTASLVGDIYLSGSRKGGFAEVMLEVNIAGK